MIVCPYTSPSAHRPSHAALRACSQVRSNRRRAVGFLADRRRLNVAITRARRHLAIVCDPATVASDALLRSLMDHIEASGQWCAPEPRGVSDLELELDGDDVAFT